MRVSLLCSTLVLCTAHAGAVHGPQNAVYVRRAGLKSTAGEERVPRRAARRASPPPAGDFRPLLLAAEKDGAVLGEDAKEDKMPGVSAAPIVRKKPWTREQHKEYTQARHEIVAAMRKESRSLRQQVHELMRYTPMQQTALLFRILSAAVRTGAYDRSEVLKALDKHLFPHLTQHGSYAALVRTTPRYDRGIAMAAGNRYFALTLAGIRVVRETLKCDYPIEVFYTGPEDLSAERRDILARLPKVYPRDLSEVIDTQGLQLEGYAIKPLSFPLTWAREMLVVDADALLFQHPKTFFEHPRYAGSGALFFEDRQVPCKSPREWLESVLLHVSPKMRSSMMYDGRSCYQQESSVLAVDMEVNRDAMLLASLFSTPPHIQEFTAKTFGDKESYFLAFEQLDRPYAWGPRRTCCAGAAESVTEAEDGSLRGRICQHITHFDDKGRPWFNDGSITVNKRRADSPIMNFEYMCYAEDGQHYKGNCYEGPLHRTPDEARAVFNAAVSFFDPSL